MLQRQANPLNISRTPGRREQVTPGPVRAASGIQIDLLGDDVDLLGGRADTLESRMAFAEADIDALQSADTTHAGQIAALQTAVGALGDGHLRLGVRKVTTNAAVTATGYLILVDAASGNVTVTLPAIAAGRQLCVKRIDASANVVSVASAALIDGAASQAITPQYASLTFMCDAATWWIV